MTSDAHDPYVRVRGASEHNLRHVDVDIPRDAMVAFTGLPPAVALQQRRGAPSSRSTVGTITTLSNLLRILYSRAGTYPSGTPHLAAEAFSPNTVAGACPRCHGLGVTHDVAEDLLVPDTSLSIRDGAIAAWPGAWQGANLRSIVTGLGIDVDTPWRKLRKKDRDWLLFTEEQPSVLIKPERARALRFVRDSPCPDCHGSGLRPEALAVTFAGHSIAEVNATAGAGGQVVATGRPIEVSQHPDSATAPYLAQPLGAKMGS